jgi:hypothetical protein
MRAALRLAPLLVLLVAVGRAAAATLRFAEWNVYWAALDDTDGRAAITHALDALAPLDFMALVEAQGDSAAGAFPAWTSASSQLSRLTPLSTVSGHETLAIMYDASAWSLAGHSEGAFVKGRPWLIGNFVAAAGGASVSVVAVHLPHFLNCTVEPGPVLADAIRNVSGGAPPSRLILAGDWNEFEWEDNPCRAPFYAPDCRDQAASKMAALWKGYLGGAARDVVPNHTITCCTKWAPADRCAAPATPPSLERIALTCPLSFPRSPPPRHTTPYHEWSFEYDHVFAYGSIAPTAPASLISYTYPGTAAPCATAACTGEEPPQNQTALHQGSWHRGWSVELALS